VDFGHRPIIAPPAPIFHQLPRRSPIGPGLSGFKWTQHDKRDAEMLRAAQQGQMEKVTELWLTSG
jgi:hypothetical protein